MRDWWTSLAAPPQRLGRPQTIAAWIIGVVTALSRFPALSKSAWDWDEALFILGVRHYDVTLHNPHPPGYPLFVGAAKILALCGLSEFHALQAVVLLSAIALFPVTLLLGREARFPAETSLLAATIVAFIPNVWLYGGTAFSDLPAVVLAMAAAALFLRGCRSDAALFAGGVVFAAVVGLRPQSALIAAVPAVIAAAYCLTHQRVRQLAASIGAGAIVVAVTYGVAAHLSHGLRSYMQAIRLQSRYVSLIDSFHNPRRTPLSLLLGRVFFRPFIAPAVNTTLAALAALGLIATLLRRRVAAWLVIAMFLPIAVMVWLYLDAWAISRYAVSYMPLFAFLAAEGVSLAPRWVREAVVAGLVIVMIHWTWPLLRELHRRRSPPAEAILWIERHANPATTTIWAHGSMGPMVAALVPQFRAEDTGDAGPPSTAQPGDVYIREGVLRDAMIFSRPRRHMAAVMRDRYFQVSLMPVERYITFADGWYHQEGSGKSSWRWMSNFGRIVLPPLHRRGTLTLKLYIPLDAFRQSPEIDIILNGAPLDHFQSRIARVTRTYVIDAQSVSAIDLRTNELAQLPGDPRLLGLRLDEVDWR